MLFKICNYLGKYSRYNRSIYTYISLSNLSYTHLFIKDILIYIYIVCV